MKNSLNRMKHLIRELKLKEVYLNLIFKNLNSNQSKLRETYMYSIKLFQVLINLKLLWFIMRQNQSSIIDHNFHY
jgi:hypothetical protein